MPSIPVPFVTLFVLLILLLTLYANDRQHYRRAMFFLAACVLLLAVGALRWFYPSAPLMLLRVLLAALLPALAWHSFNSLSQPRFSLRQFAPAALVMAITQCWPPATDIALFLLYIGYGVALIRVGKQGGDNFIFTRLGETRAAAKMALAAGGFLCFSGVTDLMIALEFFWHQGQFVPTLIALLQALMLPFIALAIVLASRTRPVIEESLEQEAPPCVSQPEPQHAALCQQLEQRLQHNALFLDSNLTLNSLARKAGIPARQISRAVNATFHCNVSQWINGFRIAHAQQLLRHSDLSITEVMLESGFMTKSNFNREFLRLSGMTPSAFRQQAETAPSAETE